jgi:AcrR family transcriptional regulator
MGDATAAAPARRPVGRPPRISREQIAEAANEIGLEGLTLKAVADHLDVSIAALYHHFSSKDELVRLAAELSAQRVPLPTDDGQHWAVWLLEWARYNRDAFLHEPALLGQYLEGAISTETVAGNLDRILGLLVREGFSPVAAMTAYETVSAFAMGTAIGLLRQEAMGAAGLVAATDPSSPVLAAHPHLRRVVADLSRRSTAPSFEDRLGLVLAGIARERGDDPDPVLATVRRALSRERRLRSRRPAAGRAAG